MLNEILQWIAIGYLGWALYQYGQAFKSTLDCIETLGKRIDILDREDKTTNV